MLFLSIVCFVIWIGLIFFHGKFWSKGPILSALSPEEQAEITAWPPVYIVVPARDEAGTVREVIYSLLTQDYPGKFRVILVDDESQDGTGDLVRKMSQTLPDAINDRLTVISSAPRPAGWSGKLWALSQGVAEAEKRKDLDDAFFFFTDADIVHQPTHLTALVHKACCDKLDQVSEMVELRCETLVERALIPAFVFFFAMLYPFSKVNNRASSVAAGAGGSVLIRRKALNKIGGIQVLRSALIDDVTLATHVKRSGGAIYLGHSQLACSLRPYPLLKDVWDMITRTAYVQLHYSLILLGVTILSMILIWMAPLYLMLTTRGVIKVIAIVTYCMSIVSFLPTLSRFRISSLWALALPFIALFYLAATIGSAINFYCGAGVTWKGRAYTEVEESSVTNKQVASEDAKQGIY